MTHFTVGHTDVQRGGMCPRSPHALVAEARLRSLGADVFPRHHVELCTLIHREKQKNGNSTVRAWNYGTRAVLSGNLALKHPRDMAPVTPAPRRTWTEIYHLTSNPVLFSLYDAVRHQKACYLQGGLSSGGSNVIFGFISTWGSFMCVLKSPWWGSECLTLGVFTVTMSSSYKERFYSEPESCLVYCCGCRQEGAWCVASEQTGCSLSSMKWKKGELIDYRHMQERSRPSRKFFWNVTAHKVAKSLLGSSVSMHLWTFPRRRLWLLTSSGHCVRPSVTCGDSSACYR